MICSHLQALLLTFLRFSGRCLRRRELSLQTSTDQRIGQCADPGCTRGSMCCLRAESVNTISTAIPGESTLSCAMPGPYQERTGVHIGWGGGGGIGGGTVVCLLGWQQTPRGVPSPATQSIPTATASSRSRLACFAATTGSLLPPATDSRAPVPARTPGGAPAPTSTRAAGHSRASSVARTCRRPASWSSMRRSEPPPPAASSAKRTKADACVAPVGAPPPPPRGHVWGKRAVGNGDWVDRMGLWMQTGHGDSGRPASTAGRGVPNETQADLACRHGKGGRGCWMVARKQGGTGGGGTG